MPYTANDLTERIDIFDMVRTSDGQGGFRETLPTIDTNVPACVEYEAPTQQTSQQQLADRERYRVVIRQRPDVTTSKRVAWRDLLLNVTGVRPCRDQIDFFIELRCERNEEGKQ